MNYNQLLDDLKDLESDSVECKENFREEEIGRTMAAFSTKKGGKIFIGVDNNMHPIGIIYSQYLKDKISQVARVCEPPVCIQIDTIEHDPEKVIVCILVERGNGSVYTYKRIAYERRQGINHPLTPTEIVDLEKIKKKLYFDQIGAKNAHRPGLISDIDIDKVKKFIYKAKGHVKEDFNLKQFLMNSDLFINGSGRVKNAAILLFGKNPSQFIPDNKVSLSVFNGNNITNEFRKTEIEGDLEEIFKKTFFEVNRTIKMYSFIRGPERVDVPEYPPEVIREAIINAIAHRDYFIDTSEIFIKIFKNRIEITNPGGFPFGGHSWEEVESSGLSIRRNPLVAEFLEKLKLMEKEGHGIKRIRSVVEEHGLPKPMIETTPKTFKLTLFGIGGEEDASRIFASPFRTVLDVSKLSSRQLKIFEYISKNPHSSRNNCCKALNTKERTTSRDLKELVNKKFLKSIGVGKGTRYVAR
tara:strand:- start:29 stop:1435 length:1407 start_codon:yes stop_codon:yes gene_type:complete